MKTLAPTHHVSFNPLQLLGLTVAAALLLAASARPAAACSCLQPSVESSYNNSSDVVAARVLLAFRQGSERWHLAQVTKAYKGCLGAPDFVLLTTPESSAACGVALETGVSYLINARAGGSFLGIQKLGIGLCDYNLPLDQLGEHDREFLSGRSVCCGSDCECADGSTPVQCFADPCSVTPACSEAATCVANYCGGCNAEFYDATGAAACQRAGECASDGDCPAGSWCRQAASGSSLECVPFVGEGESCNGFTLPSFFERCEPGLECDTLPFIADAPGICHAPCTADADCDEGEYCASDGLCDIDGRCELSVDCNLAGNGYIHPACVGYGVCPLFGSACGWQCGNPQCVDTLGYDFGPCDATLGWAIQSGTCSQVSGCSAGPFNLFPSQESCEAACPEAGDPSCNDPGAGECVVECSADTDCEATGCSGQVCASEPVITTCEFRDEYACYQDPAITSCGCRAGRCDWAGTPELAECLASSASTP